MERKPEIIGQVVLRDKEERAELQKFCRDHFNRSFSAQCRHMLLEAKRKAKQEERAAA